MPKTFEELATMIAKRDGITYEEAIRTVRDCAADMEHAFYNGNLDEAEDLLREYLNLEPDFLDIFRHNFKYCPPVCSFGTLYIVLTIFEKVYVFSKLFVKLFHYSLIYNQLETKIF